MRALKSNEMNGAPLHSNPKYSIDFPFLPFSFSLPPVRSPLLALLLVLLPSAAADLPTTRTMPPKSSARKMHDAVASRLPIILTVALLFNTASAAAKLDEPAALRFPLCAPSDSCNYEECGKPIGSAQLAAVAENTRPCWGFGARVVRQRSL